MTYKEMSDYIKYKHVRSNGSIKYKRKRSKVAYR